MQTPFVKSPQVEGITLSLEEIRAAQFAIKIALVCLHADVAHVDVDFDTQSAMAFLFQRLDNIKRYAKVDEDASNR